VKDFSPAVPPSEIVPCMEKLCSTGQFNDIVVVAGERQFHVHLAILAQRSDMFRAILEAKMKE